MLKNIYREKKKMMSCQFESDWKTYDINFKGLYCSSGDHPDPKSGDNSY